MARREREDEETYPWNESLECLIDPADAAARPDSDAGVAVRLRASPSSDDPPRDDGTDHGVGGSVQLIACTSFQAVIGSRRVVVRTCATSLRFGGPGWLAGRVTTSIRDSGYYCSRCQVVVIRRRRRVSDFCTRILRWWPVVWWCRGGLVAQRAVLPCNDHETGERRRAGTGRQTSCYVGSGLAAKLKSCYGPMALSEALRFLGPQQNCRKCIQISKNGLLSPFSARPVGTAVHASRGSTCKSLAAMVDVTTQSLRGDHRRFLRIIMRRVRRLA